MTKIRKTAFTMAEILISLTIIGIIAAITLPSLIGNINEKSWDTQRKALYSRMSQAISMMPSLNGYGIGADDTQTAQNATLAFITDGLSKVLKISNICDSNNLKKCGFPDKITKMGNNAPKMDTPKNLVELNADFSYSYSNYSLINTDVAAFETANGESILTFYNPNCGYDNLNFNNNSTYILFQPSMCSNFVYDLNGRKGPNKVGKDIGFITAIYPTDTEVAAPYPEGLLRAMKDDAHPQFTIGYGSALCRQKYGENTRMANLSELKSVFTNNKLGQRAGTSYSTFLIQDGVLTSTPLNSLGYYSFHAYAGGLIQTIPASGYNDHDFRNFFCVKK